MFSQIEAEAIYLRSAKIEMSSSEYSCRPVAEAGAWNSGDGIRGTAYVIHEIFPKGDDLHCRAALRADHRVDLIDLKEVLMNHELFIFLLSELVAQPELYPTRYAGINHAR